MTVFTGHCVMMPVPYREATARKAWLGELFDWLKNVQGDFDILLVKEGSLLSKGQVFADDTLGFATDDHVIWFFAEREDAMLFHLKWVDNG